MKKRKRGLWKVGLTGGIGAGKSTVAKQLRQAGIPVVDLDKLGKELTDGSSTVVKEISRLLGRNVKSQAEGKLNREAVREAVFRDSQLKKDLENLLHPLILREFEHRCDEAMDQGHKLIVCEAALLIESGYYKQMDELIVVTASSEIREKRVLERDKISEKLVKAMIASQADEESRARLATTIIENDGNLEALQSAVEELLAKWKTEQLI